ncbi:MAG: ATP-binding cassette domain-containing protein, partial [Oscillospiraceae bacterium]|nr:ATP-binding cassette domain-containing protein [Oscillospiraceae bacterium]
MSVLEVKNIKKSFGKTKVLKDVSFSLQKGQVLAIIGSSGSGKTTLLRCLNFLETPDDGQIIVDGKTLFSAGTKYNDQQIRENRLHFGLVFQNFNLFPQYTVLKNVTRAPALLKKGTPEELEKRGIETHTVSMDNYFRTLNRKTAPRTPEGDIDFESPLCMDMELLDDHFTRLTAGEEVLVPHFEFARQMRGHRTTPLQLGKNEVAIFEGIHALNDDIAGRHPEATKLYISARSDILEGDALRFKGTWMRLTRRAVRDHNFRGTGVAETLDMWANVRR